MVNFGNRDKVLTNLILHLHDEVIRDDVSPKYAERFLLQLSPLRNKLHSIVVTQSCAAISFLLALSVMITVYFNERLVSSLPFPGSNIQMIGAMLLFTRETQIGNTALDVHLSDLETHQKWKKYLKPTNRRRNTKKS